MSSDKFTLVSGREAPLGASLCDRGCNFSVWAPEASKVTLVLYTNDEQEICRFDLPEKNNGIWYGCVTGVQAGQLYAYSADGKYAPREGVAFDPEKLLIDPYAKKINRPMLWNYDRYLHDSRAFISKSVVVDDADSNVTEVVRGRDILSSTPRQIYLQRCLGYTQPNYIHIPLLTDADGRRLAKREGDTDLTALSRKYTAEELIGLLACAAGLLEEPRPSTLKSLIPLFDWHKVPASDIRLPSIR